MKDDLTQLVAKMEAHLPHHVKKAFTIWMEMNEDDIDIFMAKRGWISVGEEKPKGKEFFYINNQYWIQNPNIHKAIVEEKFAKQEFFSERDKYLKAANDLKKKNEAMHVEDQRAMVGGIAETQMKCPYCGHKMYKEPVCRSCREGKMGYRIRLMCEEHPTHEVLL